MEFSPVALAGILLLILLFMKVPVFAAVIAATSVYFVLTPGVPPRIIAQRIIAGSESVPMLAIPFFICAGTFMNYSGVTKRVMAFCSVLTGRMNGGLAQVDVLMATLMGGLSGSNLADAAMQAKMVVPEMRRKGFSNEFSTVVTAVAALITPLIPPGIAMIVYGSIANVSIGKMFIAGIGPGIMLCCAMLVLNSFISRKRGYVPLRTTAITWTEFFTALRQVFIPLMLPVIIIGGIRFGVFTPTEAGAIAVVYAIVLGVMYRELTWNTTVIALKESVVTTAGIMLIICAANAFAWIMTRERIPQTITQMVISVIENKYLFLLFVNVFLLFVGMFIEGTAAMIVLVPLLAPVAVAFGIDEIQFGIVVVFNMAVGCVTPPMGTVMFVTCGITGCPIRDFIVEALPYYALLAGCLLMLTLFPVFSVGIVNLMF
ncbi:MAG: TRAP transporter large permease [Methylobacteriaceae bacterium]|jgi:tripartite ATP-independent transporter DctM subunit|nr:TRAP transporter large permease [Methylobacteriaceae bacterium]